MSDDVIVQVIQLLGDSLEFAASVAVDLKVELAADAVFFVLTVLAHHDDRRLNGGEGGEKEIQEDEG